MAYDVPHLLAMTQTQLDDLFRASPPGDIPNGAAKGTVLVAPGTAYPEGVSDILSYFGWQGRVFDAEQGVLRNKVPGFGFEAVIARVYKDRSWLDQQECIVLDYSQTSLVAQWVRDEIRRIGPGFYLGRVYWMKTRLLDFCLQF